MSFDQALKAQVAVKNHKRVKIVLDYEELLAPCLVTLKFDELSILVDLGSLAEVGIDVYLRVGFFGLGSISLTSFLFILLLSAAFCGLI